ncbi:MAG: PT domain-containing protein [Saprospiraceae bacterium]|nr:PT domain-containing protein [Saprospiraceae bacterium]
MDQPTNRPTDQPTNRPTDQPTNYGQRHVFKTSRRVQRLQTSVPTGVVWLAAATNPAAAPPGVGCWHRQRTSRGCARQTF